MVQHPHQIVYRQLDIIGSWCIGAHLNEYIRLLPALTHRLVATVTQTTRYGIAVAQSWDRLHPRLTSRAAWQQHDGELPVIDGTLIRSQVDHLPGDRDPKPVWLWWSATGASPADVDRCWQAFLRRSGHRAHLPPV